MSKKESIKPSKELLEFIGEKVTYDEIGTFIWGGKTNQMIADVRGWGAIQHMFNTHREARNFQDELGSFIVDAINEKLEREQG